MDERQHIAVVDDHDDIRELVGRYLSENGFRVSLLRSASECRQLLAHDPVDLVVLDVMMPGEDGLSLCRDLYAQRAAPVILLTAMAGEVDRIVGLEIGADDYLVKPFNPRELLARVKAVLRRSGGVWDQPRPVHGGAAQIRFEEHLLDVPKREIIGPDGVSIQLSAAEFRLLVVFLKNPGVVLSREQLMQETAGRPGEALDRTIDNQISRLRRKIEPDPRSPTLIRTQWGDGYVFTGRVLPA